MHAFLENVGYDRWAITALLLIPIAGALIIPALPAAMAKRVALAVTVVEFVVSAGLWWAYRPEGTPFQLVATAPWVPSWGIAYRVAVDGISLVMVLLTTLLMPLAVLGSWSGITTRERSYYALLLLLTTGMIGVFVAMDLFLFYVFWEVMLIPMYFIIGVWGGKGRLYASIKFFIYTMLGSLLMLVAILYLYYSAGRAAGGAYSFAYDQILQHASVPVKTQFWLFGAFFLAFAIKVPMVPFHTWLPDAHVEAPTAGSVILAAILLKMGTYGFIRFSLPFFPKVALDPTVSAVIIALAVIGIVYGALVAMVQPDFKKLIAYSSVSHLGFVVLGIWALTVESTQGALMVMISHGISTGALFFLVGMIYERRHSRMIADFGGIARVVPAYAAVLTVVSLSSIGLPGTNGFVGEFLVLLGSFRTHPVAAGIATTAVVFAAAYLLWALLRVLYGALDRKENESLTDLVPRDYAVLVPLLAMIVWLGLSPGPVLRRMEPSVRSYIEAVQGRGPELQVAQQRERR
ncbi:MAG: NADH-quinone oxidoreductase subunit M [Gemmatimonadetes bacterium]|nr:NADH-quinone oxidoreductase subunit M [Gemmatimonadota bacterium]